MTIYLDSDVRITTTLYLSLHLSQVDAAARPGDWLTHRTTVRAGVTR